MTCSLAVLVEGQVRAQGCPVLAAIGAHPSVIVDGPAHLAAQRFCELSFVLAHPIGLPRIATLVNRSWNLSCATWSTTIEPQTRHTQTPPTDAIA